MAMFFIAGNLTDDLQVESLIFALR